MPPGNLSPQGPQSGMERRLLLAFALMMIVLLGGQYFFKPAPSPKPAAPVSHKQTEQLAEKPAAPATPPVSSAATQTTQALQATGESLETIDTNLYHVVFSNKGAVVKSWVVKKFRDSSGKHQLELVNVAASNVPLPFAIDTKGQQLSFDPNQVLFVPTRTPDNLGIQFEYSDGKTTVRKQFHFGQNSYLTDVRSEVIANGVPTPHVLTWRGGFGDQQVRNPADQQHSVHYDASNSKLITKTAKDAKDGPFSEVGNFSFGGLEDTFFAAVALPQNSSSLEVRTYSDDIQMPKEEKPAKYA